MEEDDEDSDEVVSEYPLYSGNHAAMFPTASGQLRLVYVHYPLRPPWRPYGLSGVNEMQYKPEHRVLSCSIAPDPTMGQKTSIHLTGTGYIPEVALCAMVLVDGSFVLLPVQESTAMRPDMQAFAAEAVASTAVAGGSGHREERATSAGRELDKDVGLFSAQSTPAPRAVKVEVHRRETERQVAARQRSYTHAREALEREPARVLRCHEPAVSSEAMLARACRAHIHKYPADVAMGVSKAEYLRWLSPVTFTRSPASLQGTTAPLRAAPLAPRAAPAGASEAATEFDAATLAALKQALESLFQDQPVVTLEDIRLWLASSGGGPRARAAAAQSDAALTSVLVGGGTIVSIQGRFVVRPPGDPLRALVLGLLAVRQQGVRRADVMAEAAVQDVDASDHAVTRVLRDLCVAHGSLWVLKAGATFRPA